jgi:predicted ATPase
MARTVKAARSTGAPFLIGLRRRDDVEAPDAFPWTLRLFRELDELSFATPVTLVVGENGSGKSTLLEALAIGLQAVAAGRRDLDRDESLAPARLLADGFRFVRKLHAKTRMFFRAEDIFGFTRRFTDAVGNLEALPDYEGKGDDLHYANRGRGEFEAHYGGDLDARSHGESFLAILKKRLVPKGLYILDEPETPLSPSRVLALMAMIKDAVASGSQFVIATHSPILMAQPDAEIMLIEEGRIRTVAFEEVEHVRVTRAFLGNPQRYLDEL